MSDISRKISGFRAVILNFYQEHGRSLAWRQTSDVYEVAVSEFMLQQTQVSRVQDKYASFLSRFPTAHSLASASQKDVLVAWQGLGYNRRALWLQGLAQFLTSNPSPSYDELLSVKGVGPYTAAAICSFANNDDVAAIDVNISRIFDRYFNRSDKEFISQVLPASRSRDWHNALMDFGSLVCTKRSPSCDSCPLAQSCHAYQNNTFSKEKSSSQPRFEGSVRWHRGQVLKALLKNSRTKEQLWYFLDEKYRDHNKFETALEQYLDEEFIVEDNDLFVIK